MGLIYFFLAVIAEFVLFMGMVFSEQWLTGSYQKLKPILRWSIFIPLSVLRSYLFSLMVMLSVGYIVRLNESFVIFLTYITTPLVLFYTLSITIPKGKKIVPIILNVLWILAGLYKIAIQRYDWITTIFQALVLSICLYFIIKIPKKDIIAMSYRKGSEPDNTGTPSQ